MCNIWGNVRSTQNDIYAKQYTCEYIDNVQVQNSIIQAKYRIIYGIVCGTIYIFILKRNCLMQRSIFNNFEVLSFTVFLLSTYIRLCIFYYYIIVFNMNQNYIKNWM
jgi:hypothetical protein